MKIEVIGLIHIGKFYLIYRTHWNIRCFPKEFVKSNRWLLASNGQGVCDRLTDLLLACRIGRLFNRNVRFVWPVNRGCGAPFEKLFKAKIDYLFVNETKPEVSSYPIKQLGFNGRPSVDAVLEEAAKLDQYQDLDLTPRYRGHDYSDFDEIIEPSKEVAQNMESFIGSDWGNLMVGVHIRRTDKVKDLGAPEVSQYAAEMDKLIEVAVNARFFVASDELECIEELIKRYGNRIITYPVRTLQRNSLTGIIDAVITLFLLRKTFGVIGSQFSGFSLCAAWNRPFTNVVSARSKNYPWFRDGFKFPTVKDSLLIKNEATTTGEIST